MPFRYVHLKREYMSVCIGFSQLLTAEQNKILAVASWAHHFHIRKMFQSFTYASAHCAFPLCAP